MSNLPLEVVEMFGQTIVKVVEITIPLAVVFSVLTHFWACNSGTPWWRKRELITDICYWFFVPLFARVFRIPQEPTIHQRFGIVVHQVLERYHSTSGETLSQLLELFGVPAAMLPPIVDALGAELEIMFDGGIRSGQDVMRAIALGAGSCMSGRAYIYGLGAGGEAGVARAIEIIRSELDISMALTGVTSIAEIDRRVITAV